jgi:hypothetical protein
MNSKDSKPKLESYYSNPNLLEVQAEIENEENLAGFYTHMYQNKDFIGMKNNLQNEIIE